VGDGPFSTQSGRSEHNEPRRVVNVPVLERAFLASNPKHAAVAKADREAEPVAFQLCNPLLDEVAEKHRPNVLLPIGLMQMRLPSDIDVLKWSFNRDLSCVHEPELSRPRIKADLAYFQANQEL
jgi:hypothetical protein